MKNQKTAPGRRVTRGTKNVFADLGFPDADVRQVKLRLAYCVTESLDDRKLSNSAASTSVALTRSGLRMAMLVAVRLLDCDRDWTCNGRSSDLFAFSASAEATADAP